MEEAAKANAVAKGDGFSCTHIQPCMHISIYAYVRLQRRSAMLINGHCSLLPEAMCTLFMPSSSSSASYKGLGCLGLGPVWAQSFEFRVWVLGYFWQAFIF